MCYPKPGPRCSGHARQALDTAKASVETALDAGDQDAYIRAREDLDSAQDAYDRTPEGIESLRNDGEDHLASQYARERAIAIEELKQPPKPKQVHMEHAKFGYLDALDRDEEVFHDVVDVQVDEVFVAHDGTVTVHASAQEVLPHQVVSNYSGSMHADEAVDAECMDFLIADAGPRAIAAEGEEYEALVSSITQMATENYRDMIGVILRDHAKTIEFDAEGAEVEAKSVNVVWDEVPDAPYTDRDTRRRLREAYMTETRGWVLDKDPYEDVETYERSSRL